MELDVTFQLMAAVLHLGKSKMEVVLDDDTGTRRRINVHWMRKKGPVDAPPEDWLSSVEGEVKYQQGMSENPLEKLMRRGFP
jgi:hypothetical protein